jgi:hypothetical protein
MPTETVAVDAHIDVIRMSSPGQLHYHFLMSADPDGRTERSVVLNKVSVFSLGFARIRAHLRASLVTLQEPLKVEVNSVVFGRPAALSMANCGGSCSDFDSSFTMSRGLDNRQGITCSGVLTK